jgi:hypothetical protein
MAKCVSCGSELHPERAEKYDYCTRRECQERNAKGLTIVALGVNKAADQYRVLDEPTREKVATGEYVEEMASGRQDRRRTSTGKGRRSAPTADADRHQRGPRSPAAPARPAGNAAAHVRPARDPAASARPARDPVASGNAGRPWTKAQLDLALIYNERGLKPDEIADKLGLRTYTVTQMILEGRSRAKP